MAGGGGWRCRWWPVAVVGGGIRWPKVVVVAGGGGGGRWWWWPEMVHIRMRGNFVQKNDIPFQPNPYPLPWNDQFLYLRILIEFRHSFHQNS